MATAQHSSRDKHFRHLVLRKDVSIEKRVDALEKIQTERYLMMIALDNHCRLGLRLMGVDLIKDQELQKQILRRASNSIVAAAAAHKINDLTFLNMLENEHIDPYVRWVAKRGFVRLWNQSHV